MSLKATTYKTFCYMLGERTKFRGFIVTEPKVYLAIDNCFASKRWTEPLEWMKIARSLGLSYVEASADTECDPLYHGTRYLKNWMQKVRRASEETGVRVSNLYSGHGSYATLGLAHTDDDVRNRFFQKWLMPMVELAGMLEAGIGFFCHAFPEDVMQSPEKYERKKEELIESLARLSAYARECGCRFIALEQMYSPHQVPWTIGQAQEIMESVFALSKSPLYITIDTGHMSGQRKYRRPSDEVLLKALETQPGEAGSYGSLWLGSVSAHRLFREGREAGRDARELISDVNREMDKYPYMFSGEGDDDPYRWLEELGRFSPTVHLQQTDGSSSAHLPFMEPYNEKGIIQPAKVIRALAASYKKGEKDGLPQPIKDICLTFEIFSLNSEYARDILYKLRKSVEYWREFIPEDGLSLSSLNKTGEYYG